MCPVKPEDSTTPVEKKPYSPPDIEWESQIDQRAISVACGKAVSANPMCSSGSLGS